MPRGCTVGHEKGGYTALQHVCHVAAHDAGPLQALQDAALRRQLQVLRELW